MKGKLLSNVTSCCCLKPGLPLLPGLVTIPCLPTLTRLLPPSLQGNFSMKSCRSSSRMCSTTWIQSLEIHQALRQSQLSTFPQVNAGGSGRFKPPQAAAAAAATRNILLQLPGRRGRSPDGGCQSAPGLRAPSLSRDGRPSTRAVSRDRRLAHPAEGHGAQSDRGSGRRGHAG